MQRRHLLKASLALAAYTGIPSTGLFALQAFANPANGDGQAFDFDWLKQHAKELAGKAYQPTAQQLPDTLAKMTPQQFNAIGYDAQHSLWHDLKGQLDVQFFHVGMGFKTPVHMYSVDPKTNEAKEVHFRPELFNYNDSDVPPNSTIEMTLTPTSATVTRPLTMLLAAITCDRFSGALRVWRMA